ncbi:uncharacterized protein LOC132280736 [Cornus florida]|uniref:uncharacterized protein LOC132280736 n=1 Tax=Cornus florida TaxID=4283 RepID=UPI00289826DE|nr:uncharacterized protein LOC132280736 [Cornus florida]
MGNCQAIDNATLVIQHPCGRVENLYWPVTASEVMKTNPGHYVALLLNTTLCPSTATATATTTNNPVRITRIKLLRPTDTLVLGQVYRLITAQEVMKGLWAKKYAKKKKESESGENQERRAARSEMENTTNQVTKPEKHRSRTSTGNSAAAAAAAAAAKARVWQPSLHSISEGAS